MCSILCFIGVGGKGSDLIIPIFLALLSANSQKQKRNNLSGGKIDQEQSTGKVAQLKSLDFDLEKVENIQNCEEDR